MNKSILFFTLAILVLSICACNGASSNISDNTLTSLQTMQAVVTQSPTAAQATSIPETTPSVETDSVSVPDIPTDYVSITDFDCGDGWNNALKRAFEVSDNVYFPRGKYKLDTVYLNDGQTIFGDGQETVIEQISDKLFWIDGKVTQSSDIAVDIKDFSNEITTLKNLNANPGDVIYLLSQRNTNILEDCGYEWCQGRSYYSGHTSFFSEFLTVQEVSENNIITQENTVFPYYYKDDTRESDPKKPTVQVDDWPYRRKATTVYLVDCAENVTIRDLSIENAHGRVIVTHWSDNLLIYNVNVSTPNNTPPEKKIKFVDIFYSRSACIKNCNFIFTTLPDDIDTYNTYNEYSYYAPLYIYAGYKCGFDNCSINFSTKGFNIGKCDKKGISYGCYVTNCTSENARWAGIIVNSGSYNSVISGNIINNCAHGIMQGGRKSIISDNNIRGGLNKDISYYYVKPNEGGTSGIMLFEGYGIDAIVKNNKISEVCTGVLIRDGYEDTNIFEIGPIAIIDNYMSDVSIGVMTYRNSHNTKTTKFELTVCGNEIIGGKEKYNAISAFLFSGSVSDILIENNTVHGFPKFANIRTDSNKNIFINQ